MIAMAKQNDLDFDLFLFPDGRAEYVLIADSEIQRHAEALLDGYIYFVRNHPEYELPHPSDFSGPKEADDNEEWARHVDDFSWMLHQWRDDFMGRLLED